MDAVTYIAGARDADRGQDENGTLHDNTDSDTRAARPVRARLNGIPCLVTVSPDDAAEIAGAVAVAPFAGERAPLPVKGQRATLDLVDGAAAEDLDPTPAQEPIELMVSASNRRSGRFTARVLALSEEQARILGR
ncbi:hypothetical protein [uncultured Rhodospira sp.]|uniref:hypothetical protein n=1 Tax=uncultured Rhodospira sp. TaxID=1936189 RepID=UPI002620FCCB|nr:hypothetical protein [uncultured Rhodospira sp.]